MGGGWNNDTACDDSLVTPMMRLCLVHLVTVLKTSFPCSQVIELRCGKVCPSSKRGWYVETSAVLHSETMAPVRVHQQWSVSRNSVSLLSLRFAWHGALQPQQQHVTISLLSPTRKTGMCHRSNQSWILLNSGSRLSWDEMTFSRRVATTLVPRPARVYGASDGMQEQTFVEQNRMQARVIEAMKRENEQAVEHIRMQARVIEAMEHENEQVVQANAQLMWQHEQVVQANAQLMWQHEQVVQANAQLMGQQCHIVQKLHHLADYTVKLWRRS
jgi:hypothetical protein